MLGLLGIGAATVVTATSRAVPVDVHVGAAVPAVRLSTDGTGGPLEPPLMTHATPAAGPVPTVGGVHRDGGVTVLSSPAAASTLEASVVELTNRQRLAAGCGRLRWSDQLALAAARHGRHMVASDFFDHVAPDGSRPVDRAAAAGFRGGVGENLAAGYSSATSVVDGWMHSPGHRANILDCRFSVTAVAVVDGMLPAQGTRGVWVQIFGTPDPGW